MDKLFHSIYLFIAKRRLFSAFCLLILVAVLSLTASNIKFNEDISQLIPANAETEDIQQVLKAVNFTDKIIVNVQRQSNGSITELTEYATRFIDSTKKNSSRYVESIQGKVNDNAIFETLHFVYQNIPLFLDESDYKKIRGKLPKDSILNITKTNYKTLLSPSGIVAKKTIVKDPLGLSFLGLKKLQQLGFGDGFTIQDGFVVSEDGKNLLLFISPAFGSSETAENAKFATQLYALQEQLNSTYSGKIKSEYFGAALIAVANAQQIKRDIQFTVGIALSILILIFIFFYKKVTIPLILFVPTIFGGLLSITILYVLRTEISAISLGIGSVLLGVTLDYSLHILTHIRNNESIEALFEDVTKPILMSSLTTALAFLCLLFLDSQALQDLGIFAAVSVLGASVFALIFIPQVYKNKSNKIVQETFLDRLAAYPFHKNKWLIGLLCILFVLSAFTYNRVVFNKDISKLNYEPAAMKRAEQHLDSLTNSASKSIYLANFGKDSEAVLQANDSVYSKLKQLEKQNIIVGFNSIGGVIHSKKQQQRKIDAWKLFWKPEILQQTKENLISSGNELGFKPNTFQTFYDLLETNFSTLNIQEYNALSSIPINDFIGSSTHFTTVTSLMKVDSAHIATVNKEFEDFPNTLIIDRQQMNETFLGGLKEDFNRLIGYSVLVVLLLLFLYYRSFSLTLVTCVPIFLTWLLTIGMMGLFNIEFNIFNIIISTFIFGLGIDYSIFITNGLLKEYKTGEKALGTHKTSIVLSVLTTILGVGVLIFAKHPALYSISLVSIIGIFSAVLIAFTLQPLLFTLFIGSKTKRPITFRLLMHSVFSFGYYGLGGIFLSFAGSFLLWIIPGKEHIKKKAFHTWMSKFMKSVLFTNPFVKKRVYNNQNETFKKPAVIIANHTSFLDILAVGMLHPNIIFLVNDWVYNSPVFGRAVRMAGFYPVSGGIDKGVEVLRDKVDQGYSLMIFPEGTRSKTNKIRRFHKGAFYLAETFKIDVLPILIHGNSEVLPKGSFVIKDGGISVKILPRIEADDVSFGATYREKTKNISRFFKKAFNTFRSELEDATYFHSIVLEDFRYKGKALYSEVKRDLNKHANSYKKIIDSIGEKDTILHLSEDKGQLDLLLALDAADRKISSYIKDKKTRDIITNSYITQTTGNITMINSLEKALTCKADVLIVNMKTVTEEKIITQLESKVSTVIMLKESRNLSSDYIEQMGYHCVFATNELSIFNGKAL
ncbi:MMPL family transporter [Cochleicola gelatinilyticus]|uniref:Glycerol acyltransferase n=1 Tax=Cochleicola gelatinilyticus TaxID=1763537 RepID=A0A167JCH7_9FLAO|nr:MMPL family transporter [Cochleicola gelatinilyticus]OAB80540.1 glycerol acyltransferase [Cochleicola gelatinilyticus]